MMARRNLTLTMSITLDEDTVRDADPVVYTALLTSVLLRCREATLDALADFDPNVESPEIVFHGVEYVR